LFATSIFAFELPNRRLQNPEEDKYKPLTPTKWNDSFKAERAGWYKYEEQRLSREKAFHGSEFNRYNRQQKWNDDRKAAIDSSDLTVAQRVKKILELDEQANIDIDDINAHVNYKKNMRNPANREEDRALRIFNEARKNAWSDRVKEINAIKIPAQPKAVAKRRRELQQKVSALTNDQKKTVEQLKALWSKMHNDLQAQIDLNLKFHTVEFEEFV